MSSRSLGDRSSRTSTRGRSPRSRSGCSRAAARSGLPPRLRRRRLPEPRDPQADQRGGHLPERVPAPMVVTARLKHVAGSRWKSRRYLDMTPLDGQPYRIAGLWGCRKVRKTLNATKSVSRAHYEYRQFDSCKLFFLNLILG